LQRGVIAVVQEERLRLATRLLAHPEREALPRMQRRDRR